MGVEHWVPIIVQNLPLPSDRRVWPECHASVEQELAWCHHQRVYLSVYQNLTAGTGAPQRTGN